jgi:hypothetical protein
MKLGVLVAVAVPFDVAAAAAGDLSWILLTAADLDMGTGTASAVAAVVLWP